jgi:hypothetical protein
MNEKPAGDVATERDKRSLCNKVWGHVKELIHPNAFRVQTPI